MRRKKTRKDAEKQNNLEENQIDFEDVDENEEELREKSVIYEREFKFHSFEAEYGNEEIVANYCRIVDDILIGMKQIGCLDFHEISIIECIHRMFHRLYVKLDMPFLFHKLSFLVVFQKTLDCDDVLLKFVPEFPKLITEIVNGFFTKLKEYPLLYIQLFYPKHEKYEKTLSTINEKPFDPDEIIESESSESESEGEFNNFLMKQASKIGSIEEIKAKEELKMSRKRKPKVKPIKESLVSKMELVEEEEDLMQDEPNKENVAMQREPKEDNVVMQKDPKREMEEPKVASLEDLKRIRNERMVYHRMKVADVPKAVRRVVEESDEEN